MSENNDSELKFEYLLKYAHENENAESQEERHGAGQITLFVDHEVTTFEEIREMNKTIFRNLRDNGTPVTKVVITSIAQVVRDDPDEGVDSGTD